MCCYLCLIASPKKRVGFCLPIAKIVFVIVRVRSFFFCAFSMTIDGKMMMKKSWLNAIKLEESLANVALLPLVVSSSLESLTASSNVHYTSTIDDGCLHLILIIICFLFFYYYSEFLFKAILQVKSFETDQERHQIGTEKGHPRS